MGCKALAGAGYNAPVSDWARAITSPPCSGEQVSLALHVRRPRSRMKQRWKDCGHAIINVKDSWQRWFKSSARSQEGLGNVVQALNNKEQHLTSFVAVGLADHLFRKNKRGGNPPTPNTCLLSKRITVLRMTRKVFPQAKSLLPAKLRREMQEHENSLAALAVIQHPFEEATTSNWLFFFFPSC